MSSHGQYDFSAPLDVSTPTVLLDWEKLTIGPKSMLFAVVNLSPTDVVTMVLETSEHFPCYPDDDKMLSVDIPPLRQGSFEVGPSAMRTYFRLSAHTAAPGFQVASVAWMLRSWWW